MGRPKKEKAPLPEQSPSNPNQALSLLSKAKETLALAKKRKTEGGEGVESVPTPCKAKTVPPCPKAPQQRLRSKSPANMAVAPKQPPPKPAASAPSSSAFDRVQAVLAKAKAMRMDVEQNSKAAPPPKPTPPVAKAKTAPLAIKAVGLPAPPKAVSKTPAESLAPESVSKAPNESLGKAPALPSPEPATPPPKASLSSPHGSMETITSTADTTPDTNGESGQDDVQEDLGNSWGGEWGTSGTYKGWNSYGWDGSYDWRHSHYWDSPGYDSQWRYDPAPHSTWRPYSAEYCPTTPGSDTHVREFLANRQPSFAEKLSKAAETPTGEDGSPKDPPDELGEEPDEDDEGGEEVWMQDKKGNIISPKALYMRFYRKLRSKKNPPPPEVAEQFIAAQKSLRQVAEEKHSTSASLTMEAEANNGAHRMLTECQALQNKLQGSDKYKKALLEDLVAAEGQLASAKQAAVTALATKTDDLKSKCDLFKKVSDPVKACLRKADPSSKAKAKKRAKPAAE
eukprot:s2306_g9.t1